jgi:hypothetical protein
MREANRKDGQVYSAFAHLAQALLVGRWKQGYWLMMNAYFDESRIDPSHQFSVVAGFVSSTDLWTNFEKMWSRQMALKPKRVKWKKYIQQNPIPFAQIARTYSYKAINFPCSRARFQEMHSEHVEPISREKRKGHIFLIDNVYAFCSSMCCESLDYWAKGKKLNRSTPIKVVFDKGSEYEYSLEKGYQSYFSQKSKTYLCGAPIFDQDDFILPLQAAHLFAWLLSKHYNEAKSEGPEHEALKIICERGHATQPVGQISCETL